MVVLNGEVSRFLQQVGMTFFIGLCQHSFIETIKTSKTIPANVLTRIRTKYVTDLYSFIFVQFCVKYLWEWNFCKITPKQRCALLWSILMFLASCYYAYFIGHDFNWSRIIWVGSNKTLVVLRVCGSVLYCYGRTLGIVHCLDDEPTILCMYLIADP